MDHAMPQQLRTTTNHHQVVISLMFIAMKSLIFITIIFITDFRRRALGRGAGGKRLSGAVCGCRGKRRLGAHPTDTR
jgi:hypothetical protein